MKYRKLILLLILFLLSGCNVNYDITINEDSSIKEEAVFQVDDTDENFEHISKILKDNNISKKNYKILRDNSDLEVTYKKEYETVEDYILNSTLYKQVFDDIDIVKSKTKTTLTTSADFRDNKISINNDNSNHLNYLQINITSNLPVISENSDTSINNIYTWNYNKQQLSKEINFSFRNTPKLLTIKSVIIITVLVLVILFVSINLYGKFKKNKHY